MNDDRTPTITADTQLSAPKSMPPPRPEKLNKSLIAETRTPADPNLAPKSKDNPQLTKLQTEITRRLLSMPRLSVPMFAANLARERELDFQPFLSSLGNLKTDGVDKGDQTNNTNADPLKRLQISSTAGIYQFQRGVSLPYMRKSLSLNYEHVALTKNLVALTASMAQMLEAKLEAIKLNTAAADGKKSESWWSEFRRTQRHQLITKTASYVSAKTNDLAKAAYAKAKPYLEERLYKPAAENYQAYRAGTKTASDIMAEAQAAARKAYEDGYNHFYAWRHKPRGPNLADFMAGKSDASASNRTQFGSDGPLRIAGPMLQLRPPTTPTRNTATALPRLSPPTIEHDAHAVFYARPDSQFQQPTPKPDQNSREAKSSSGKQSCLDCCDDLIKRLDNIYGLMKTHFTRQEQTSRDSLNTLRQEEQRGEAPRAGSYADHLRELAARRKATAAAAVATMNPGGGGGTGGTSIPAESGWLTEILGSGLGGLVGGKLAKYAGKAGKGVWTGAKMASRYARPLLGLGSVGLAAGAGQAAGVGDLASKLAGFAGKSFIDGGKLTGSLASSLLKSATGRSLSPLGNWFGELAGSATAGAAAKGAVKGAELGGSTLLKSLAKKIPGIGALVGAGLSVKDLLEGEYINAAGDLASGLVSTIPGIGTGASLAIDGAMLYRNLNRKSPGSAPPVAQKPGLVSRTLYGTAAEVSNGRVTQKAQDGIVGKLWSALFGSKTEQTADGQIVKDGSLGVVGALRHGAAQTLRFMSNSIFGQYTPDGKRIQGSSYLEQSEAELAQAWGRGKSIIEQTAAGLKQGVTQFSGFLFGGNGQKNIIERTWDSLTTTISDWGKTLSTLASNAWTGLKNAPGAIADAAKSVGQHVADTVAAIPQAASDVKDALKNAPGAAYDALKSGASSVAGGVAGAASYIWNKATGGPGLAEGNNLLDKLANTIDTKPDNVTVPLPQTTPQNPVSAPSPPPALPPQSRNNTGGQPAIVTGGLPTGVVGDGQCVSLVKQAANIGPTATWAPGDSVLGNQSLKPGTVIATFGKDGRYENRTDGSSHAAIYLGPSPTKPGGIRVYDQWVGHPASVRDIGLTGSPVDNAKFFRVVTTGAGVAATAAVATNTMNSAPDSTNSGMPNLAGAGPTPSSAAPSGSVFAANTPSPDMAATPVAFSTPTPSNLPMMSAQPTPDMGIPTPSNDNYKYRRASASSPISGPINYTPPTYNTGPGSVPGAGGGMPGVAPGPVSGSRSAPMMPGSGAHPPMTGSTFAAKSPQIAARLQSDFGLTPVQAAGIVGNLGHESGGFTQMQEKNPIGGGRGGLGWAQWTGPRRVAFEKYLAETGQDAHSDEANYGFLKQELQTTQKGAITAVKKTNDLSGAVNAFESSFERANPKYVHLESREKYAQVALAGAATVPTAAGGQAPAPVQVAANGVGTPTMTPTAPASGLPASGIVPVSFDPTNSPVVSPTQVASIPTSPPMIPNPAVITNGAVDTVAKTPSDTPLPTTTSTPSAPPVVTASVPSNTTLSSSDPSVMKALESITGAITDMHSTLASGKMMGPTNDLLQAHLAKPNTVVAPVTNNSNGGGSQQANGTQNDLDFSKAVKTATGSA